MLNLIAPAAILLQTSFEEFQAPRICRDGLGEGNPFIPICEWMYAETGSEVLAVTVLTTIGQLVKVTLVLLVAVLLHRMARRLIRRLTEQMKLQSIERLHRLRGKGDLSESQEVGLARATLRTETIGGVLRSIAAAAIWVVALLMVLSEFAIDLAPLLAGAGIVGIALGFGAQRLVQDFLSGILMLIEDQFGVGDIVDVGEATGVVEAIGLRTTRIRSVTGTLWHVPNGQIDRVGNMSQAWSRALLDIGIAYGSDIDTAWQIMERVSREMAEEEQWQDDFVGVPEIWGVQDLGDSQVTIRLVAKVSPARQWAIEREMRRRIKYAFDAAGIEIPFPQRTVWMRHDDGEEPSTDGRGARPEHAQDRTP